MPHLVLQQHGKVVRGVALTGPAAVIGRSGDIVLSGVGIAPQHARIVQTSESYVVESLDESYPTCLNGLPIQREALNDHDEISVGDCVLVFHKKDLPVTSPADAPARNDMSTRGAMTFDQDSDGQLGERLRGMLQKARENNASAPARAPQNPGGTPEEVRSDSEPAPPAGNANDAAGTSFPSRQHMILLMVAAAVLAILAMLALTGQMGS